MPIDPPLWGSDDGGEYTNMHTLEAELTVDSILTSDVPMSVNETQVVEMLKILQATLSQQTMMLQTYEEHMQAAFQQQTDIHKVEMQERMHAEEAQEHMLIAKMQEMLAMTNASFAQKELDISNMKLELQKLEALKEDEMAAIVQKQVRMTQTHAGEAMGSPSEV
ncbi:hypothetical protein K439DRAFT_1619749 [Ramaria rubella]|nr:hypothetical protein K439DRAFT_1619749 [Ramaria rubella]